MVKTISIFTGYFCHMSIRSFFVGLLPAAHRCSRTFSPLDDGYAYSYIQYFFFKI